MRRSWGIAAGILMIAAPICKGSEPAPISMFVLPKIELRKESGSPTLPARNIQQSHALQPEKADEFAISAASVEDAESSVRIFEAMNGEPILSRLQIPDEPAGAIGWVETRIWDPVFAPEVVKLGKVHVSGGIVAAIKRKNPFCLLNPLAFVASW